MIFFHISPTYRPQPITNQHANECEKLKYLPKLTYLCLNGTGHLMQIENPNAFNFHLKEWLESIK